MDFFRDTLPGRLAARPQFQVLYPVVGPVAVYVVDVLAPQQTSTKGRLHDESMLEPMSRAVLDDDVAPCADMLIREQSGAPACDFI